MTFDEYTNVKLQIAACNDNHDLYKNYVLCGEYHRNNGDYAAAVYEYKNALNYAINDEDRIYVANILIELYINLRQYATAKKLANEYNIQRNDITIPEFTENKICVYAICKNEKQFVDAWLESMSEADYIVVLDTGSTDGTFEMLRDDPRVYKCEQKVFTNWRFDTARNESMMLIPDDANILLCTDLDEILEPGWADEIRSNWNNHVQGWYKYAWSHDDTGNPGRIFMYNKIHDPNFYWSAPVHELLKSDIYDYTYIDEHLCNLFDGGKVFLHHWPDKTKSRSSYLPLLEKRALEMPDDYYGLYYLSHEYYYRGHYEKSIALLDDIYNRFSDKFSTIELAAIYLFKGDAYRAINDTYNAIAAYYKAIDIDKTYREPYLNCAEIFNELGMHHIAIGLVNQALANSYRHYNWIERDTSWNEQSYDILSVSYYGIGDYLKAFENSNIAYNINSTDTRIKNNYDICLKTLYCK